MAEDNAHSGKINYSDIKKIKIAEVISTIKHATFIENLLGIFRFSLVDGELCRPNRKMKVCTILIPAIIIIVYAMLTQRRESRGVLITVLDVIPSHVILAHYAISAIIMSFLKSQTCIHVFENFAELDGMLSIQTTVEFYNQGRYETKKYLIVLTVFHVISCVLDFVTDDEPALAKLIVSILYLLENLNILTFCKLIAMLKRRLEIINSYLARFIQDHNGPSTSKTIIFSVSCSKVATVDNFNWIGRASAHNMKIRDLATMYDMIGHICSLINEVSSFQIFMTMVSTFSFILIAIWSTIYFFRKPDFTIQWLLTVIVWCFTAISTVAVMSITCETLLSVRNHTKTLVNKIVMDYDLPKTMRVQAKAFMQLIEAWPLRILIYDLFSVDINLMLKFISVVTTYLIVIIQISHFL